MQITNIIPFDIETAPDENAVLYNTDKFDESSVKLGNIKDPEKIEAKIADAKAKYWTDVFSKAALNPYTSTICAIGMALPDEDKVRILQGDEKVILTAFWSYFREFKNDWWCFYSGNNMKKLADKFDIRHILVRSQILEIAMPVGVINHKTGNSCSNFIDVALTALVDAEYRSYFGLERACKAYRLVGKDTRLGKFQLKSDIEKDLGVTGANFHELQYTQPEVAEIYLKNDVLMTLALSDRLIHV